MENIKLRWLIEECEEYDDGIPNGIKHKKEPVLQVFSDSQKQWVIVPTTKE